MRPLKFLLVLMFGAAVLFTFIKILLFALMAVMFFGGLWAVARVIRFLAFGDTRPYNWHTQHNRSLHTWKDFHSAAPPISLGVQRPAQGTSFERRIEVI